MYEGWGSLVSLVGAEGTTGGEGFALTLWGTVGYLSEHVLGRTYFRVWAYAVDFGDDLNR